MTSRYFSSAIALVIATSGFAQLTPGSDAYQAWKLTQVQHPQPAIHPSAEDGNAGSQRDNEPCACWIEPDSSYALAMAPNDDGSSEVIPIPFAFNLYGDQYTTCFINNNGNVSFGAGLYAYTSNAFPLPAGQPALVAPFWADVDTRMAGEVQYKVTSTAIYVNWMDVGYYSMQTDKLNSFQLIITDGTDPAVPGGNNVSFCYGNMEWTTGAASSGVNGFGGVPATVGANKGDGVEYLQLGRFNHDSTDWDGAYSDSSGVAWLIDRHFSFSTENESIPPIFTSIGCDTLEIEVGSSFDFPMMMIGGTPGQTISGMSQCSGIANYVETQNISGSLAKILSTITPTASEVGLHAINYTAQNDAATPLVSTYTVYVKVLEANTGIHGATATSLSVQPNPASDHATITWPDGQRPELVEVFSLTGALVLAETPNSGASRLELDLGGLPDGIYTVRATGATSTATVRLVRSSAR